MTLALYNTAAKKKEPFVPLEPGRVKMYVCGPTVYDDSHVGHARPYVVFDILVRYLKSLGYEVLYVRNLTDLDDKLIDRANEKGVDYLNLADKFITSFHEDMDALGLLRPDIEPRATEHIELMKADIKALMDKGYAYRGGSDVFFHVPAYQDYGRLSGRDLDELQAGARIKVDPNKKSPLDFVLWKGSKPGEPSWDSPWGPGRPGWHSECSAMSAEYLGREFDIHGGGEDLIFPHHENEWAQAAPLGRPFARYWIHNGFVRIDHQKMSKSLKNFFTIKEILEKFHPEVLRLFVLSRHYRGPVDFSDEALRETDRGLDRAYRTLKNASDLLGGPTEAWEKTDGDDETAALLDRFREAMDDDLNTARALGHVFEAVRELNRLLDEPENGQPDPDRIRAWLGAVRQMGGILGILELDPDQYLARTQAMAQAKADLTPDQVEAMIEDRAQARIAKNWAEADRIRDELNDRGVILEDIGGETRWRFAKD